MKNKEKEPTLMGFNITVNNNLYYVKCDGGFERNMNEYNGNYFGLNLRFVVKNVATGEYLQGHQIKNTYLAEKIQDYVINSINGQRRIYFDWYAKNENGDVVKDLKGVE